MAYEGTLLAAAITTGAAPSSNVITFPTHEDVYGKGGMMCVSTYQALTSIPLDRQKLGMMIYVSENNTYYRIHTTGYPLVGVTGSFSLSSLNLTNGLTITGVVSGNNLTTSFNQGSATGSFSFAVGSGKAFGTRSHAEGNNTTASGINSHAEGSSTTASGANSHAEGQFTVASGNFGSHAEGSASVASGEYSHAQNGGTNASGWCSHAEGYYSFARGRASHAAGYRAVAQQDYTYAWTDCNLGTFPLTLTDGISTTRSGQYMVSASGGVFFPGKVGIGTDSIDNSLTVVGDISAAGTLYGKAQDLSLNATSTNTVANSAITSALQLLSPAPTYVSPTASLTNFSPSVFEVGQTVTQALTLNWNQNDAGSLKAPGSFLKNGVEVAPFFSLPATYNVSEPASLTTTTYQLSVNFNTGPVKNNVLGFPDTRGQITAGSRTISRSFTGYHRRWIGSNSTFPTTPASIRTLSLSTTLDTNNTLASQASPIYISNKFILIAIPNTKTLTTVVTEANENLTSQFSLSSIIQIPDASSTLRDYKLYYLETAVPLNANLTNVTIS